MSVWNSIIAAAKSEIKGLSELTIPQFIPVAYNPKNNSEGLEEGFKLYNEHNLVGYVDNSKSDGKNFIRSLYEDLVGAENIVNFKKKTYIFDDGKSVITKAEAEGYNARLINNTEDLEKSLQDLLDQVIKMPIKS